MARSLQPVVLKPKALNLASSRKVPALPFAAPQGFRARGFEFSFRALGFVFKVADFGSLERQSAFGVSLG